MKITFPSAPIECDINVTNLCNLDCRHCNVAATKNAAGDLTTAEWKRLIDELASMKVFKLTLGGGEPFMRPDIFEIIEHIFSYHFRLHINTNGTLIDRKTARFLKRFDRIDCVQVSVEGSSAKFHEKIRPEGSFEPAVRGISFLKNAGVPVITYTVVNRHNRNDIEKIVTLGKKLGADSAAFTDLLPVGNAYGNYPDLALSVAQRLALSKSLRRLRRKYGGFICGPLVKTEDFFGGFASPPRDHTGALDKCITSCGGGFDECAVRPDGWVIPCARMWEYTIGNVREKSFREIWNRAGKMRDFRRRRAAAVGGIPECAGCRYIPFCSGGCPAVPFQYGRGTAGWDPTSCYKVYIGEKQSYVPGKREKT